MSARNSQIDSSNSQIVLVVTDDAEAAALWISLFKQKGCLAVSESSAGAIQAGQILNPWLVLVDVQIAHAERLALCRALRSNSRATLLMLTPLIHQEIAESYAAGVDECIVEPVSPVLVLIKAMSWMVRRQLLGANHFAIESFA